MSVVVVGGGVLGFMHALEARRRGHAVTHLEREPGSRGASVRNFGLIWVSGRAGGPELDLARRARARWAEIAAEVPGTGFRPNGSLTLARDDAELGLLKEAATRPDAGPDMGEAARNCPAVPRPPWRPPEVRCPPPTRNSSLKKKGAATSPPERLYLHGAK